MKLDKKKSLAVATLGIGRDRIIFNNQRLKEIEEAITKQDIRDLVSAGAISIRPIIGTRKVERRKTRRRAGSIKKKIKSGKRGYMILTRKLRSHIKELRGQNKLTKEQYIKIRKEIRAHSFRSKSHLKENISNL